MSDEPDGTGVGLFVVRTVAENHGGSVAFGTSPLGGAEVRCRLSRGTPTVTGNGQAVPAGPTRPYNSRLAAAGRSAGLRTRSVIRRPHAWDCSRNSATSP